MGKRLKISFVATLLVVCTFSAKTFCEEAIKVSINGEAVQMNQNPVIVNGRTLVPLRVIFEALGVKPVWDEKARTVSATNGTVNMNLVLGDSKAVINGKIVNMDVPGTLINNSTMVPARFIAETLGANVEWDQETKTVLIQSSDIQSSNKLSSSNVAGNDPMSNLVIDANDEIKISVNGTNVVMSEPPVVVKGKVLVPIRSILAALGVAGSWNDPQKTLTVNNDFVNMRVVIGEETATVNEKIVQLETPGAIINSSALIPVRFIAETMGAQVDWNKETKTIQIKSKRVPIPPADSLKISIPLYSSNEPIKEVQKTIPGLAIDVSTNDIEVLKDKIIFENDIRLFTLYAFMNYTGYDEENAKKFSSVRQGVRDDLFKSNPTISDNHYYKNKGVMDYEYTKALKQLGNAPNFELIGKIEKTEIQDLGTRLREFYQQAGIEKMYNKYKPYYDVELAKYEKESLVAIAKTNNLLKIDNSKVERFYVNVNLLDAYARGHGLGEIDKNKNCGVIITGPSFSDGPNILNIVHEYLHGVINPIIKSLSSQVVPIKVYPARGLALSQGYSDYSIATESIIRGISAMLVDGYGMKQAEQETIDGFVLTAKVSKSIGKFKDYKGSLESFISLILKEYDEGK